MVKRMTGAGKKKEVGKVLKKVNTFLKKNKLISKGAKVLVKSKIVPKKHRGKIKAAGEVAELLGYGTMKGRGTSLPGGGLRLAGTGKRRKGRKKGAKRKARKKK